MSNKKTELAFPTTIHNHGDGEYSTVGMTLRDYFAAKAMQSFVAMDHLANSVLAKQSYEMADAMLKAREA